jgi:hypothetical protein
MVNWIWITAWAPCSKELACCESEWHIRSICHHHMWCTKAFQVLKTPCHAISQHRNNCLVRQIHVNKFSRPQSKNFMQDWRGEYCTFFCLFEISKHFTQALDWGSLWWNFCFWLQSSMIAGSRNPLWAEEFDFYTEELPVEVCHSFWFVCKHAVHQSCDLELSIGS